MNENDATAQQLADSIKDLFGGVSPLEELSIRINDMSAEELRQLVLVSCNQIGTAIKRADYEDMYDSAIHLNLGANLLLMAYDSATMMVQATVPIEGHS